MDRFDELNLIKSDKKLSKKILTNKKLLLLFVSLAYNILVGNIKLKNKKKLKAHKHFLLRLASLEGTFQEKIRLIKNISQKKLRNILILLLHCTK